MACKKGMAGINFHLLWEQGVAGSNPATPTIEDQSLT